MTVSAFHHSQARQREFLRAGVCTGFTLTASASAAAACRHAACARASTSSRSPANPCCWSVTVRSGRRRKCARPPGSGSAREHMAQARCVIVPAQQNGPDHVPQRAARGWSNCIGGPFISFSFTADGLSRFCSLNLLYSFLGQENKNSEIYRDTQQRGRYQ